MSYCTKPKDLTTSPHQRQTSDRPGLRVIPSNDNVKIGVHAPVESSYNVITEKACTRLNDISKGSGPYHNAFAEQYRHHWRGIVSPQAGPHLGSVRTALLDRNLNEPTQIQRPHVHTQCKKVYRSPLKMRDGSFIFGDIRDRSADENACQEMIADLASKQTRSTQPVQLNRFVKVMSSNASTLECRL